MTCFNGGRFLAPSIASIAAQTFRDWEFLIVDDASTDRSREVASGWAARDPRIRLIENSRNKGQTACLNQGLAEARGKWIARQDADDLSHPLRLTRQFETVTARPDLVLLGTSARMIDAGDRLCGLLDVPLRPATTSRAACFLNPFLHTSVFFRRDAAMESCGGYDTRFRIAQDYDLWCRMLEIGPCANLSARLVAYRHLPGSLSKAGSETAFSEAAVIADRYCENKFPGMDAGNRAALAALREGDPAIDPAAFRRAFHILGEGLREADGRDWSRFAAITALRIAGQSRRHRAGTLVRALRHAPLFVAGWLGERAGMR